MNPLLNQPAFAPYPGLLLALADAALKGVVLLILASGLTVALRKASAAARHLVWCSALVGLLLLPIFSIVLPAWRVPWLPDWQADLPRATAAYARVEQPTAPSVRSIPIQSAVSTITEDAPAAITTYPASDFQPVAAAAAPQAVPPIVQANYAMLLMRWSGMLWLFGVAIALSPLLIGCVQILVLTRRCTPVNEPAWQELLAKAATELSLQRKVRMRRGENVNLPLTWGAWRPLLLLPTTAEDWTPERRRVVLLHELAHIKRWDWLTQMLAYLACALYWFNPLAWVAARRMRIEREQACDDLVLRSGSRASDYAEELLQLATGLGGKSLINWASVPMARRSTLEERLRAILDGQRNHAGMTRAAVLSTLALAALIIVPIAMLRETAVPAPRALPSIVLPGELVVNGGFEDTVTPAEGVIRNIGPGAEPPKFGWKIMAGDVDVTHMGYDSTAGVFSGVAASGNQWLDLDGVHAGTISQTIATKPGVQYTMTFAYANNPGAFGRPPYFAHLTIEDAHGGGALISPLSIRHATSKLNDYHWVNSGPITFTAQSNATTLTFISDDDANSCQGIFLDDISVIAGTGSSLPKGPALSASNAQDNITAFEAKPVRDDVPVQSPAESPSTMAGAIQAAFVVGDVRLQTADGIEKPLHGGDIIRESGTLATGADGSGLLVFFNGSTLKIPNRSTVKMEFTPDSINVEVKPPGSDTGSTFTIKTSSIPQTSTDGNSNATADNNAPNTPAPAAPTPNVSSSVALANTPVPMPTPVTPPTTSPTATARESSDAESLYKSPADSLETIDKLAGLSPDDAGTVPDKRAIQLDAYVIEYPAGTKLDPPDDPDKVEDYLKTIPGVKILLRRFLVTSFSRNPTNTASTMDKNQGPFPLHSRGAQPTTINVSATPPSPQPINSLTGTVSAHLYSSSPATGGLERLPQNLPPSSAPTAPLSPNATRESGGRDTRSFPWPDPNSDNLAGPPETAATSGGLGASSVEAKQTALHDLFVKAGLMAQDGVLVFNGHGRIVVTDSPENLDKLAQILNDEYRTNVIADALQEGSLVDVRLHADNFPDTINIIVRSSSTVRGFGSTPLDTDTHVTVTDGWQRGEVVYKISVDIDHHDLIDAGNVVAKFTGGALLYGHSLAGHTNYYELPDNPPVSVGNTHASLGHATISGGYEAANNFIPGHGPAPRKIAIVYAFWRPGLNVKAAAAAVTSTTITSTLPPGEIQAMIVQGDVRLKGADGTEKVLGRGDTFRDGSTVVTGANGNTLLVFSNGATVKVTGNAELKIIQFKQAPFDSKVTGAFMRLTKDPSQSITELELTRGSLGIEVKPLNTEAGSTFTIKTPSGTKAFTNGAFGVAADTSDPIPAPSATFTPHSIGATANEGNSSATPTAANPMLEARAVFIDMPAEMKADPEFLVWADTNGAGTHADVNVTTTPYVTVRSGSEAQLTSAEELRIGAQIIPAGVELTARPQALGNDTIQYSLHAKISQMDGSGVIASGNVTTLALTSRELFSEGKTTTGKQVVFDLGLVPQQQQSGTSSPGGPIFQIPSATGKMRHLVAVVTFDIIQPGRSATSALSPEPTVIIPAVAVAKNSDENTSSTPTAAAAADNSVPLTPSTVSETVTLTARRSALSDLRFIGYSVEGNDTWVSLLDSISQTTYRVRVGEKTTIGNSPDSQKTIIATDFIYKGDGSTLKLAINGNPPEPLVLSPIDLRPRTTATGQNSNASSTASPPLVAAPVSPGPDTLLRSVNYMDAENRKILREVADLFLLNLVIPDTLTGTTTVKLSNVTWQKLFKTVLDPIGYTYVMDGNIVMIVKKDALASITPMPAKEAALEMVNYPDTDIKQILRNIADLYDLNLVIPDTLSGTTSIKLRNVTWEQVFKVILEPVGYTFVQDGNTVTITKKNGKVLVSGEVNKPGLFPFPADGDMTVTMAVQQAGGFTDWAIENKVLLVRVDKDGKRQEQNVDVEAVLKKGDKGKDVKLQPDDRIIVNKTYFKFN